MLVMVTVAAAATGEVMVIETAADAGENGGDADDATNGDNDNDYNHEFDAQVKRKVATILRSKAKCDTEHYDDHYDDNDVDADVIFFGRSLQWSLSR